MCVCVRFIYYIKHMYVNSLIRIHIHHTFIPDSQPQPNPKNSPFSYHKVCTSNHSKKNGRFHKMRRYFVILWICLDPKGKYLSLSLSLCLSLCVSLSRFLVCDICCVCADVFLFVYNTCVCIYIYISRSGSLSGSLSRSLSLSLSLSLSFSGLIEHISTRQKPRPAQKNFWCYQK